MDGAHNKHGNVKISIQSYYERLKGRGSYGEGSVDRSMILKWIVRNKAWNCEMDSSGSGHRRVAVCCLHENTFYRSPYKAVYFMTS
jgi:hypothetical protein